MSVAQLCLSFGLQNGHIILPKSTHFERMKENLLVDRLTLDEADMQRIRSMPLTGWGGEHPDRARIQI